MNDRRIEIQGGGDGTGFKLSVYFDRLPQMALPKYRKLLHLSVGSCMHVHSHSCSPSLDIDKNRFLLRSAVPR